MSLFGSSYPNTCCCVGLANELLPARVVTDVDRHNLIAGVALHPRRGSYARAQNSIRIWQWLIWMGGTIIGRSISLIASPWPLEDHRWLISELYKYPHCGCVRLTSDCQHLFQSTSPLISISVMKFTIILALASGGLAAANSLPLPDPNNLVERKEATCRVKSPFDASGDPWRTGRCKTSKSACGATGGEAFRYVQLAIFFCRRLIAADGVKCSLWRLSER